MNEKKLLVINWIVVGLLIVVSGVNLYLVSCCKSFIKQQKQVVNKVSNFQSKVLTLKEASNYLKLTESEVKSIIVLEENRLEFRGSFSGQMLSYFKMNDKYYFYKETLDKWLNEVTNYRKEYNSDKGTMSD